MSLLLSSDSRRIVNKGTQNWPRPREPDSVPPVLGHHGVRQQQRGDEGLGWGWWYVWLSLWGHRCEGGGRSEREEQKREGWAQDQVGEFDSCMHAASNVQFSNFLWISRRAKNLARILGDNARLTAERDALKQNIGRLLKTARAEINRWRFRICLNWNYNKLYVKRHTQDILSNYI